MSVQIMIIGLGRFGMALAQALSDRDAEIIAVDSNKARVEDASHFVTDAICLDATDEAELARLMPSKRDAVVCTIGSPRESSILCTALLRQMGAKRIVSRTNDPLHARILRLVGAHEVVNPEEEIGRGYANKLLYHDVVSNSLLGGDLHLTEVRVPNAMVGKTLPELNLPTRFGITVVAVRRGTPPQVSLVSAHDPFRENDHVLVVSSEAALNAFLKEALPI